MHDVTVITVVPTVSVSVACVVYGVGVVYGFGVVYGVGVVNGQYEVYTVFLVVTTTTPVVVGTTLHLWSEQEVTVITVVPTVLVAFEVSGVGVVYGVGVVNGQYDVYTVDFEVITTTPVVVGIVEHTS